MKHQLISAEKRLAMDIVLSSWAAATKWVDSFCGMGANHCATEIGSVSSPPPMAGERVQLCRGSLCAAVVEKCREEAASF
jgi:hypothetical protein